MNTLRTFFGYLWLSISSVDFYHQVLQWPLKYSLLFFFSSMLLLGVLRGIAVSVLTMPEIRSNVDVALQELVTHFPEDLILDWDGTSLKSNFSQVTVGYPTKFRASEYDLPPNLALLFPKATDSVMSDFPQNQALLIITEQDLLSGVEESQAQPLPLTYILPESEVEITKSSIPQVVENFKNDTLLPLFSLITWINPFVFAIATPLATLFIASVEAVLLFVMLKLYGRHWSFKKSAQLAFHVAIPATLLDQVTMYLYPAFEYSLFSIAFWLIVTLVLFSLKNTAPKK